MRVVLCVRARAHTFTQGSYMYGISIAEVAKSCRAESNRNMIFDVLFLKSNKKENSKLLCKLTKRQRTHTFTRIERNLASISFSFQRTNYKEHLFARLFYIGFLYFIYKRAVNMAQHVFSECRAGFFSGAKCYFKHATANNIFEIIFSNATESVQLIDDGEILHFVCGSRMSVSDTPRTEHIVFRILFGSIIHSLKLSCILMTKKEAEGVCDAWIRTFAPLPLCLSRFQWTTIYFRPSSPRSSRPCSDLFSTRYFIYTQHFLCCGINNWIAIRYNLRKRPTHYIILLFSLVDTFNLCTFRISSINCSTQNWAAYALDS